MKQFEKPAPPLSREEARIEQHELRAKAWKASGLSARENFLGEVKENILGLQEAIADINLIIERTTGYHSHHANIRDRAIDLLEQTRLLPDSPRKPGDIRSVEAQVAMYTKLAEKESRKVSQLERQLDGLRMAINSWKRHLSTYRHEESRSNWQAERDASLQAMKTILVRNLALQHLLNGGDVDLLDFNELRIELFAGTSRDAIIAEAARRELETGELEYPVFDEQVYLDTVESELFPFMSPLPPIDVFY